MKLLIGLSYSETGETRYNYYPEALAKAASAIDAELEVIDLFKHPARINDIDGILFTGGPDIAPVRYGKNDEIALCGDINEERDTLEWQFAERSEERKLPTLGICRGAQLLNVVHGGTLLTDIEHFGGENHKRIDLVDRRHAVHIDPGTLLRKLVRESDGEINSSHHQAIERVGEGLTVTARASDGTAEAIEWADPIERPFWLAVQWHPERMEYNESFSHPLFESFLLDALGWKMLKSRIERPTKANA